MNSVGEVGMSFWLSFDVFRHTPIRVYEWVLEVESMSSNEEMNMDEVLLLPPLARSLFLFPLFPFVFIFFTTSDRTRYA